LFPQAETLPKGKEGHYSVLATPAPVFTEVIKLKLLKKDLLLQVSVIKLMATCMKSKKPILNVFTSAPYRL
jgi:hypothetical protein